MLPGDVLLDRDVAELYGVETKRINEALRNNPDKFPEGYVFTLQPSEKQEVVENFDRLKTIQFSTVEPHAFTERGLYMLATILKSKQATSTTLAIIDSFVKLREISRNIAALHQEQDKEKQKSLVQRTGELMNDLLLDDGETTETESTVEINLVALKFKHTVKRVKKRRKRIRTILSQDFSFFQIAMKFLALFCLSHNALAIYSALLFNTILG